MYDPSNCYDLHMRTVCAKKVPRNLNDRQKAGRNEVPEQLQTEPDSLTPLTTGGETCFVEYGPECNSQDEDWSPRQKKVGSEESVSPGATAHQ
jgi:hypothetical protein